ncbi:MAG: hypothetical protein P4L86_15235 [Mycobacterium sp.]|nr:hypothetical protein [Mycobacterium sp.]
MPAALILLCLWRIFGGLDPTVRFFDDFFYYAKTAQHWANGAGATFFPGEPTNGYHPAWFVWLSVLYWTTGNDSAFFAGVDLSVMLLLIGFFFLFDRFLCHVTGRRLPAAIGAAAATLTIAPIAYLGLEMAFTAFFAAALLAWLTRKPLAEQSLRDAAIAGVLCALMVLGRLDAMVLAPCLLVATAPAWGWRRTAAAFAGGAPLYGYISLNVALYGHIGTTSMTAKSLRSYFPPNLHYITHEQPVPGGGEIGMVIVAIVVAMLAYRIANSDGRRIALALTIAPILQLVAQAFLSGWALYPWYLYFDYMAVGLATALVACRLADAPAAATQIGIPVGMLAAIVLCGWLGNGVRPDPAQVGISQAAQQLRTYAARHPGVYAMGDAAGTPAWLMDQPVVHLEGLMMSHSFIDLITTQQPLAVAFKRYHVDYYVAVRSEGTNAAGCPTYREPNATQASVRAPAMRMTICSPPAGEIKTGNGYRMLIYRIDPATGLAE